MPPELQRPHIPLRKWAIATYLWATSLKGVSSMKLHRDLGITRKSAYFLAQRLREAGSNMPSGMKGPVEAEEHEQSRGKTPVAALKDRDTGRIAANSKELHGFVRDHAEPGAALCADESPAYKGLSECGHEAANHSVAEYVRGMAHSNGVESFWSSLKRAQCGTFHHISEKHLHRYVLEFASRRNMRPGMRPRS